MKLIPFSQNSSKFYSDDEEEKKKANKRPFLNNRSKYNSPKTSLSPNSKVTSNKEIESKLIDALDIRPRSRTQ